MPDSKIRSFLSKFDQSLDFSPANLVDWAVTGTVLTLIAKITFALGGMRPEGLETGLHLGAVLVLLHGLWLLVAPDSARRVSRLPLLFVPALLLLGIGTFFFSQAAWLAKRELLAALLAFIVLWVVVHNVRGRAQQVVFMAGLQVVGLAAVVSGLIQHFRHPDRLPLGLQLPEALQGMTTAPFGAPAPYAGLALLGLFPALAMAGSRRYSAGPRILFAYAALLFAVGIYFSFERPAWTAVAFGAICLPYFLAPSRRSRVFLYGALGLVVAAIFFAVAFDRHIRPRPGKNKPAATAQSEATQAPAEEVKRTKYPSLWAPALRLFYQSPITGVGPGSFPVKYEKFRPAGFDSRPTWAENDYIHLLAEMGVLGFLAVTAPVAYVFFLGLRFWRQQPFLVLTDAKGRRSNIARGHRMPKRSPGDRVQTPFPKMLLAGLLLALLAIAVHAVWAFHLHVPALLLWIAAYLGLIIKTAGRRRCTRAVRWFKFLVVPTAVAAGLCVWAHPLLKAAELRLDATNKIEALTREPALAKRRPVLLKQATADLLAAAELDPRNGDIWAELAYAELQRANSEAEKYREIAPQAEAYAIRALETSRDNVWYRLYLGQSYMLNNRLEEAEAVFREATSLGPNTAQGWYYLASCLSLNPAKKAEASAAAKKALELAPDNEAVKRLRRRLLIP